MRTSKPIISGPACPRAPDLQPNLACLRALSFQPPSLDCSQMPIPEVFPPTSLSQPLDLLLNIISSKTFPDHIIYSSLLTVTLSSALAYSLQDTVVHLHPWPDTDHWFCLNDRMAAPQYSPGQVLTQCGRTVPSGDPRGDCKSQLLCLLCTGESPFP